jgi:DNA-directed RNA polymerase specialized sigma24 family protein
MTAGLGEPVSDTELAARFQRDPEMFTVVYDRYVRDIFRYVGSRLGAQTADDIAAETFMVAFGQRDRFDPSRGSLRSERLQPQLARALTRLSRGERDVILLIALSELSHEEVSQALGISYGTVGSRLSRARKKLQGMIDQEKVNG